MMQVTGRPKARESRLSSPEIVAVALAIARRQGLDALTMRALAAELQVSVGAVYRHVTGREELVDLLVEYVLGDVAAPSVQADDGWQALQDYALTMQDLLDKYPGLDQAVIARASTSPAARTLRRRIRSGLQRDGLTAEQARAADRAVSWLWLGSRLALSGRAQRPGEARQFAVALAALTEGLRSTAQQGVHT